MPRESDIETIPAESKTWTQPELICYRTGYMDFDLRPAPVEREWMDAFPSRHPYKCLPLAIANTHGWQIHLPCDIAVTWNGGPNVWDLVVSSTANLTKEHIDHVANSNFSMGIFTFHTGFIFRTSPGWNLLVTGPVNNPKRGCHALMGIIETHWLPYPFTMNYQFERPGSIYFEAGEPIAQIMPVPFDYLTGVQPEIRTLESNPELTEDFHLWREDRHEFLTRLSAREPEAMRQGWQRRYFTGIGPDGTPVDEHISKLRLKPPVEG